MQIRSLIYGDFLSLQDYWVSNKLGTVVKRIKLYNELIANVI